MITVGELFAGIGGFSLAFHAAGAHTAWFVEKEPFCQQVLSKHWPDVPVYGDIYECHDLPYVDVITAGFPCQPFSLAGKRQGVNDERYLVPEMLRVIQEVQPRAVVFENVPGFTNIADGDTFNQFLRALAEMGLDAQWGHIRASDLGAPHQRERWLCVAYPKSAGHRRVGRELENQTRQTGQQNVRAIVDGQNQDGTGTVLVNPQQFRSGIGAAVEAWRTGVDEKRHGAQDQPGRHAKQLGIVGAGEMGNASSFYVAGKRPGRKQVSSARHGETPLKSAGYGTIGQGPTERRLDRIVDGLPARLDGHQWPARPGQAQFDYEPPRVVSGQPHRTQRLKALGNAVVPQVVYPIACEIVTWLEAQADEEGAVA